LEWHQTAAIRIAALPHGRSLAYSRHDSDAVIHQAPRVHAKDSSQPQPFAAVAIGYVELNGDQNSKAVMRHRSNDADRLKSMQGR
jgi:hypothetical protein